MAVGSPSVRHVTLLAALACLAAVLAGCGDDSGNDGKDKTTTPAPTTTAPAPAPTTTPKPTPAPTPAPPALPPLPDYLKVYCEWLGDGTDSEKVDYISEATGCDDKAANLNVADIVVTTITSKILPAENCKIMVANYLVAPCGDKGIENIRKNDTWVSCDQAAGSTTTRKQMFCDIKNMARTEVTNSTTTSSIPYGDGRDCATSVSAYVSAKETEHPGRCVSDSASLISV